MARQVVIARKPLDWFKEGKNARKHRAEAMLRGLGKSLRIRQIHAIIARLDGTVLDGWSRVLAAMMEGLTELDVTITDEELTDTDIAVIQHVSAEHRSALTDGEKWRSACALLQMNMNWGPRELCDALGLEPASVTILLSPCKCVAAVQDALMEGKISLSVVYAISKASSPEEQLNLLNLKLHGATRDELDRVRKQRKAPVAALVKRMKLESDSVVFSITGNFTLGDVGKQMQDIGKEISKAAGNGVSPGTFERLFREERAIKEQKG